MNNVDTERVMRFHSQDLGVHLTLMIKIFITIGIARL